jgi:hypothetical protein
LGEAFIGRLIEDYEVLFVVDLVNLGHGGGDDDGGVGEEGEAGH